METLKIAVPSLTSSNMPTKTVRMPRDLKVANCRQKNLPFWRGIMVVPGGCRRKLSHEKPGKAVGI